MPDRNEQFRLANRLFTPRRPITDREMLSGRLSQISRMIDTVDEVGAHAIVYGERGAGKTSLVNCFRDLQSGFEGRPTPSTAKVTCNTEDTFASLWERAFGSIAVEAEGEGIGFRSEQNTASLLDYAPEELNPATVTEFLQELSNDRGMIVILDEFDRVSDTAVLRSIGDTIKATSDDAVDATLIIVGVGDSVTDLIREHESVTRNVREIKVPRMPLEEQRLILSTRLPHLELSIESKTSNFLLHFCRGLPFYVHLLGRFSCTSAIVEGFPSVETKHVRFAISEALQECEEETRMLYFTASKSSQRTARYKEILAACALAPTNDLGFFNPVAIESPFSSITGKEEKVDNFNRLLLKLSSEERGAVLKCHGPEKNRSYRFRSPMIEMYTLMRSFEDGIIRLEHLVDPPPMPG